MFGLKYVTDGIFRRVVTTFRLYCPFWALFKAKVKNEEWPFKNEEWPFFDKAAAPSSCSCIFPISILQRLTTTPLTIAPILMISLILIVTPILTATITAVAQESKIYGFKSPKLKDAELKTLGSKAPELKIEDFNIKNSEHREYQFISSKSQDPKLAHFQLEESQLAEIAVPVSAAHRTTIPKNKSHFNSQLLQQKYITPRETSDHSQNYSQLTIGGQLHSREKFFEYNLEGHVQSLFGNRLETYWYLKEGYYSRKWENEHTLTIGRKLQNWSKVDREWVTGLWESSYRVDGYQFLQQGLTGLFYSYNKSDITFKVFASPFFTPDQGPLVNVRGGRIVSNNRWFNNNIDEVIIGEVRSPLVYRLETPGVADVVLQESFALGISWGNEVSGWQFSLNHADKPINQLYIGIRPLHSISLKNVDKVTELYVIPQVHRHRLSTAELLYTHADLQVWTSINWDRPYLENLPDYWVTPQFVDERIAATGLTWKWNQQNFTLGYINRQSGVRDETSGFIEGDLSHMSDRYIFREASLIRFSRRDHFHKLGSVEFSLQWIRSLASDADMLSFKWDYSYFRNWSWSIGGDIIGSQSLENEDFFSRNRSNDRLYGGVSYVF